MSILLELGMGLASVVTGGLGGALLRLAPEAIKFFRGKVDDSHEYRMRKLDLQIAKDSGASRLRELDVAGGHAVDTAYLEAYGKAVEAQGKRSGVRWADALSTLVRPLVTFIIIGTWVTSKVVLVFGGPDFWGPTEDTMLSGILGFWFMGRVFDKEKSGGPSLPR